MPRTTRHPKSILLILLAVLALVHPLAASTQCGGSWTPGIFQPSGTDFTYQNQPIHLAGYYPALHALGRNVHDSTQPACAPGETGCQRNPEYYKQLIDFLKANHINLIRVTLTTHRVGLNHNGGLIAPYEQVAGACCTATPDAPTVPWRGAEIDKYDLNTFNQGFFDHWNTVLSYAKDQGIMVIVAFFEARGNWVWEGTSFSPLDNGETIAAGRKYDFLAGANNINNVDVVSPSNTNPTDWYTEPALGHEIFFVEKAVEELGHHENIIWELGNETPAGTDRLDSETMTNWENTICTAVHDTELASGHPRHAVMPRDLPEHRTVPGHLFPGDDPTNDAEFEQLHADLIERYGDGSGRPLISDNDCCANEGTVEERRKKAWTTMVSGAYPLLFNYQADEGYESLFSGNNATAVRQVGYTRQLVLDKGIDITAWVPRDDLLSSSGSDVWLRAVPGFHHVAYFLTGGSATLDQLPTVYEAQWFDPRSGTYTAASPVHVDVGSATFNTPNNQDWVLYVGLPESLEQIPYGTPSPRPLGSIDAPIDAFAFDQIVNADTGLVFLGQRLAYNDLSPGNGLGTVRSEESVDIITGNPNTVGDIEDGEWLEYTVEVPESEDYHLYLDYATRVIAGDGSITVTLDPGETSEVSQTYAVANSNNGSGIQQWKQRVFDNPMALQAGTRVLRLTFGNATFDLRRFQMASAQGPQLPFGGAPTKVPSLLEAEHFDGGALAGYFDFTPENQGGAERPDEWVDISEGGTGRVVSGLEPGEWMEYTVEMPVGADSSVNAMCLCPIELSYSSLENTEGRVLVSHFENDVLQQTLELNLPANGAPGPLTSTAVGPFLGLGTGIHVLRVEVLEGNFALDTFTVGFDAEVLTQPDAFFVAPGQSITFSASELLANDEPAGEIELLENPIVHQPAEGVLSYNPGTQTFTYIADTGTTQNQSFEYQIRSTVDPTEVANGHVSFEISGNPPVANNDPEVGMSYQVPPGGTLRLTQMDLMANDTGHLIEWGGLKHPIPDGLQVVPNSVLLEYTAGSVQTTVSFEYRVKDHYDVYSDWATVSIQITGSATLPVGNTDDFFMAHKKTDGSPAQLGISLGDVIGNDFVVPGGGIPFIVDSEAPDVGHFEGAHSGGWNYVADPTALEATFKYELGQGTLHSGQLTDVRVHAIPAPVGGQDTFTVGHDTVLEMDLQNEILANDNGFGADISAIDFTQPANGSLDLLTPGVVRYTADPGFADDGPAVDTFTYVVVNNLDGLGFQWATRSAPVTVSITVQPPDAVATDDVVHVATGVQVFAVPLATLFRNDSPADELVLVELGDASAGTVEEVGDALLYTPGPDFDTFGRDAFTYTVRRFGGNPNVTSTATVTVVSDGAYAVELHDTFEGPDLSAWDTVYVGQGNAAFQSVQSAYTGYQGVELHLKTQNSVYLRSGALFGATHGAIAMDIDPSRLTMADGDNFNMLAFSVGTMKLRYKNGTYQVQVYPSLDGGASAVSGWVDLKPEYQTLRVEWRAASAPGLTDGFTTLWLDGVLVAENANLKNGTRYTSNVLLGAAWGMQATTSGRLFLDNVRLSRGPLDQTRHAWDDFESGTFDAWTGVASGGGIVGLGSDVDGQWMEITPDGSNLYTGVYENFVAAETHYGARFHLDLHTLAIPDSQSFFLLNGTGGGTLPANLRLRNVGGQWQVAAMGIHDGGTWATTGWHDLPGSAHHLGIEWWSASGPAANDGGLRLMIDDQLIGEALGIDNDTRFLKQVVLGSSGADPGTTGTFLLDDYRSWRGTRNRTAIVADDFDDGLDSVWDVFGVGAVTTVQSVSAFGGSQAATFQVSPGAAIAALQHQGESLATFEATFDLHLGSLSLPDKAAPDMMIFTGSRPGVYAFSLRVRKYQGQHELRLVTYDDAGPVVSSRLPIDPASVQSIGLSWWRSSGVDTGDGGIRLVIDDGVVFEVTDLDNDTQHFDRVRLGAVASIDATTSGTFHIDNFQSWR